MLDLHVGVLTEFSERASSSVDFPRDTQPIVIKSGTKGRRAGCNANEVNRDVWSVLMADGSWWVGSRVGNV